MKELRLKIKKRVMPSKGRVRLNISALTDLGINDGGQIDLMNDAGNRTVTVTVYTDTMVEKDQIRISEEDLKALGLQDGDEVTVAKAVPMMDKLKKTGAETKKNVTEKAEKAYQSAGKATKEEYEKVKKKLTEKDL
jgi:formylmethanofuran dehydrogenase subunit D